MRSFYLESAAWPEDPAASLVLDEEEARHAVKVVRVRRGEVVRCFDGRGREARCEVSATAKNAVTLTPQEVRVVPPPARPVTLAVAWTKAARRSWLVEKAVELQAAALWFWQAGRSQGDVPVTPKASWTAQAVAGAKQCEAAWLPVIRTFPGGLAEVLDAARAEAIPNRYVLWEREGAPLLSAGMLAAPGGVLLVVGPEGGFNSAEQARFLGTHQDDWNVGNDMDDARSCRCVSLGRRVLRWETAALLGLGLAFWAGQGEDASP